MESGRGGKDCERGAVRRAARMKPGSVEEVVLVTAKDRKPYTISKSRESWTEAEHTLFLEAISLCVPDALPPPTPESSPFTPPLPSHTPRSMHITSVRGTAAIPRTSPRGGFVSHPHTTSWFFLHLPPHPRGLPPHAAPSPSLPSHTPRSKHVISARGKSMDLPPRRFSLPPHTTSCPPDFCDFCDFRFLPV